MAKPVRIVSWNIAHRVAPWRALHNSGYDVALLQEAAKPPPDVAKLVHVDDAPWLLGGGYRLPGH